MSTGNSIDEMIAQAENRSSEVANSGGALVTQGGAQALTTYESPRRLTLDDFLNSGGMTVDNWLKVTEDGLKFVVENKSVLLDKVTVEIDMQEVAITQAVKFGNPPRYYKTYDGVICSDGQTRWRDALEMAQRDAQRPYQSADIPMTLLEDVKKGSDTLLSADQRIGYSLSTTNKDAFAKFLRDVNDKNLRHEKVEVVLGFEPKTNKNKQTWGIVTFQLVGKADERPDQ